MFLLIWSRGGEINLANSTNLALSVPSSAASAASLFPRSRKSFTCSGVRPPRIFCFKKNGKILSNSCLAWNGVCKNWLTFVEWYFQAKIMVRRVRKKRIAVIPIFVLVPRPTSIITENSLLCAREYKNSVKIFTFQRNAVSVICLAVWVESKTNIVSSNDAGRIKFVQMQRIFYLDFLKFKFSL